MSNPWSAFYWGDYIADTGHLTLAHHGAYLLLMAHYYRTRRPLPASASILHRICRCTTDSDRTAVDDVLAEFFTIDGDVYRHRRIDQELAKAADVSEKRRAAANAKHQKYRAANALRMHTQPQPQSDSQSQPESDIPSPLLENDFVYSKEKDYSQADFDARDLRKLSDELNKIELSLSASVGSISHVTEKQVFECACDRAGISVERGLEVQERGRKWPGPQSTGASA